MVREIGTEITTAIEQIPVDPLADGNAKRLLGVDLVRIIHKFKLAYKYLHTQTYRPKHAYSLII